jgi:FixJ family two-component response regulator
VTPHCRPAGGNAGTGTAKPEVLLLADAPSVPKQTASALANHGYTLRNLSAADELWSLQPTPHPACVIVNHRMKNGFTGFQLLEDMKRRGLKLPTLFMAADWNVELVVSAIKSGAEDFIASPFEPESLLESISRTMKRAHHSQSGESARIRARILVASLSSHERQIVSHVLRGLLNKEIADRMELALITIKVYRARAMKKLGAGNAVELARIARLGGICDGLSPQRHP